MQEILKIPLSSSPLEFDSQNSIKNFEKALFERQTSLGMILSYYYRDLGGLVENVCLAGKINFDGPSSGTFTVNFDVVYYNACWDTYGTDPETMILHFNLNEDAGSVMLYGPSWPERGQDEI